MAVDLKTTASFRIFGSVSEKFLNTCLILYQIGDIKPTNIAQQTCKWPLESGLLRAVSEKKTLESVYGKCKDHRFLFLREINGCQLITEYKHNLITTVFI